MVTMEQSEEKMQAVEWNIDFMVEVCQLHTPSPYTDQKMYPVFL